MPSEVQVLTEWEPAQGIVTDRHPYQLPTGTLVDGRNVRYDRGRLSMRDGTALLKDGGVAGGVANIVGAQEVCRFARYFETATQSPRLVVATQSAILAWDAGAGNFVDKSPAGGLAGADIPYYDAVNWLGNLYVTKQGNEFMFWDGGVGLFVDVTATSPAGALFPTYIRAFNGYLVGAHCQDAGATLPQSIYWSVPVPTHPPPGVGTTSDWNGAGSGNETRVDLRGQITGLELVGRGMAIFAEESIDVMREGPTVAMPFLFHTAEPTLGCPAPHSICPLGPPYSAQVVFLGSDSHIHVFNGNRALPVSENKIHAWMRDNLEEDHLCKAWGHVLPNEGVYLLAVATGGATENNAIIEWNYWRDQFYLHELGCTGQPAWSCTARWVRGTPQTWATIKVRGDTWASVRGTWSAMKKTTGRIETAFLVTPTGLLVDGDWMHIFEGSSDWGQAISAYAQFAPTDGGTDRVKEIERVEIVADRTGATNLLTVEFGASMDAVNFDWESNAHALGPTDKPYVDCRKVGKFHGLRVGMDGLDQHFRLRAIRLAGRVVGKQT